MSLKHRYAKKYLSNSIQTKCDVALQSYQALKAERNPGFSDRKWPTSFMAAFAETAVGVDRDPEHLHG